MFGNLRGFSESSSTLDSTKVIEDMRDELIIDGQTKIWKRMAKDGAKPVNEGDVELPVFFGDTEKHRAVAEMGFTTEKWRESILQNAEKGNFREVLSFEEYCSKINNWRGDFGLPSRPRFINVVPVVVTPAGVLIKMNKIEFPSGPITFEDCGDLTRSTTVSAIEGKAQERILAEETGAEFDLSGLTYTENHHCMEYERNCEYYRVHVNFLEEFPELRGDYVYRDPRKGELAANLGFSTLLEFLNMQ
ncbi:MAG: hypothetical protein ABEJ24_05980 [Candidatus Magasanikbacteria bacterium]